jgi:release factor glutamine methyltransferase
LGETELSDSAWSLYKTCITRRAAGICVAYITGHKEFRYLDLYVSPDVLVPRPDTETLVEAALEIIKTKTECGSLSVLDLCTGSGAVALALLDECKRHEYPRHKYPWHESPDKYDIEVYASDISPAALLVAQKNSEALALAQATATASSAVRFIQSNLFENIEGRFDIIVSNPPYVRHDEMSALPPEVQNEPPLALDGGEDGLMLIKKIIPQAAAHLKDGGALLLEADPRQMSLISALFQQSGYEKIFTKEDLSGCCRLIGAVIGAVR